MRPEYSSNPNVRYVEEELDKIIDIALQDPSVRELEPNYDEPLSDEEAALEEAGLVELARDSLDPDKIDKFFKEITSFIGEWALSPPDRSHNLRAEDLQPGLDIVIYERDQDTNIYSTRSVATMTGVYDKPLPNGEKMQFIDLLEHPDPRNAKLSQVPKVNRISLVHLGLAPNHLGNFRQNIFLERFK